MAVAVSGHFGPWTEADLLALPDDAQRYELLEGSLVVKPPPTVGHQRVAKRLTRLLDGAAPGFEAVEAVGVRVADGTLFVPDVVVAGTDALEAAGSGVLDAAAALLVVEVVSPSSRTQDRITKPALYAVAGIPAYWRVEQEDGPVVHVFRLVGSSYSEVGSAGPGGRLELTEPFPISFDPAQLRP